MKDKIKMNFGRLGEKIKSYKSKVSKKNMVLVIVVLCVLAAVSAFFLFSGSALWDSDFFYKIKSKITSLGRNGSFPYTPDSENIIESRLCFLGGNLAAITESSFESITLSGRPISSRKHNFVNPEIKSAGNRAIFYDTGRHGYRIETSERTVIDNKSENKIMNCAISKEGSFALVTDSKNYLSELTVFNKRGKEKYKYYFAQCYILNLDIKDDGSGATLCGFYSKDGVMESFIYVFDFSKSEPEISYEWEDCMAMDIKYLSSKNVAILGSSGIKLINISTKEIKDVSYNDKILRCSNFSNKSDKMVYCLSCSKGSRECDVVLMDKDGNLQFTLPLPHAFDFVKYAYNSIYGVENGILFVYDTSGTLKHQINLGPFTTKVLPYHSCVYFANAARVNRAYLE